MVIFRNSTLFVNYFAFYACISVFLCITFVFSQLQMVLAAKKKAYRLMLPIRCFLLLPIQDTALLIEAAYPFWTCVRGPVEPDDRPRTLCTNCTQGIQYPNAGICLLGIELPRGFHTFPRGCRFPGRQERRTPPLGTSSERKSHREAIYPSTN